MKKSILLVILWFSCLAGFGQMKDKMWVMFGTELVHGSYSAISPQVMDDRYKLQNMANSRFEIMGKKGNAIVDFSINSIWVFNMNNDYRSSSLTQEGFHKVRNMPLFRFCHFKLKGDENSSKARFGLGWQFDWRRIGLENNSDNNSQSAYGSPGLSYGPLELKGRFGIGGNIHLARQTKNLYSRISLNLDYSPGRIQGASLYPEATFILSFKRIALYGLATYRFDYVWGNRQAELYMNNPKKTSSLMQEMRLQIGVAIDVWKFSN